MDEPNIFGLSSWKDGSFLHHFSSILILSFLKFLCSLLYACLYFLNDSLLEPWLEVMIKPCVLTQYVYLEVHIVVLIN